MIQNKTLIIKFQGHGDGLKMGTYGQCFKLVPNDNLSSIKVIRLVRLYWVESWRQVFVLVTNVFHYAKIMPFNLMFKDHQFCV